MNPILTWYVTCLSSFAIGLLLLFVFFGSGDDQP